MQLQHSTTLLLGKQWQRLEAPQGALHAMILQICEFVCADPFNHAFTHTLSIPVINCFLQKARLAQSQAMWKTLHFTYMPRVCSCMVRMHASLSISDAPSRRGRLQLTALGRGIDASLVCRNYAAHDESAVLPLVKCSTEKEDRKYDGLHTAV
jgi:hypothetical protein